MNPLHPQALGLFLDLVGVALLGWAFFFKSPAQIFQEAGSHWDYNQPLAKAIIGQKFDGLLDTAFLVAGFALQLLGVSGVQPQAWFFIVYCWVLLFLWAYVEAFRHFWVTEWVKRVAKQANR